MGYSGTLDGGSLSFFMKMARRRSLFQSGLDDTPNRSKRPVLFGVCFAKNEEDIIADSVTHAADFCDKVFVVDNASTDRTWEIVKGLKLANLVTVCSKDFVFRDYLRLRFMDTKKEELGLDNWWYIFDADEFLVDDPFDTIIQAEEERADCIAVEVINFLITRGEFRDAQESLHQETWHARKHYVLYESGPVKFFKNTKYVDYNICDFMPFGITKECSQRLLMKHYPYRSLAQLKNRVYTRYGNREFESECKRGTDLERYTFDPATVPEILRLDEKKGLDLTGGFGLVEPRIGESARDRTFAVTILMLHRLRLLRVFYGFYRRYAAWRQKVNVKNEPAL
ncbi:MAG: glycosyltransferase family 2 protein [Deltaproteobacteria bacterium]|nr:MAG: glycosyltransferase family 2 protein [Deltaproteobacteria bacterium]